MSMALRWITNRDQVKRCDSFALFEPKRKLYFATIYAKYNPTNSAFPGAVQYVENLYRQYTDKYDSFKFWSNSPNNLRDMAAEAELLYAHTTVANDLWHYETPYSMASDHIHCNSVSMAASFPVDNAPYEVTRGHEPKLVENAAFSATQWLFDVVKRVDAYRGLGIKDKIDKAYRPFETFVLNLP